MTSVQPIPALLLSLKAPFELKTEIPGGKIAKGQTVKVKVTAVRNPAYAGPINLAFQNLPAGITAMAGGDDSGRSNGSMVDLTAAADAAAANVANVIVNGEGMNGAAKLVAPAPAVGWWWSESGAATFGRAAERTIFSGIFLRPTGVSVEVAEHRLEPGPGPCPGFSRSERTMAEITRVTMKRNGAAVWCGVAAWAVAAFAIPASVRAAEPAAGVSWANRQRSRCFPRNSSCPVTALVSVWWLPALTPTAKFAT